VGLPLAGVRVVGVEQYGAGPWGSMYLADLGAEVIKVEPPGVGDVSRIVGPHFLGAHDSHFFQSLNRNKRSITLDLKTADGRAVFEKLVATADAVLNNLRGDQPAKLRLRHDDLRHVNPKIVCAHLSAYGRDGSRAGWPGYDYLMQAEAGYFSLTGEPGSPPARMGLSMVDYITGIIAALALVSGVLAARRTGRGMDVDTSLYDAAMHQLSYPAAWHLNEGTKTERLPRSAHPALTPCQLFPTADGWIYVMCQTEKFWRLLTEGLERPELAERPEFRTFADRLRHRERLSDVLDEIFRTRKTTEWLERLRGSVPVAPVFDIEQALANPFTVERGLVQSFDHPERKDFRVLASPVRVDGEIPPSRPAPALGADTDAVLRELGYDDAAIASLRARGIV
jgi:crotonobetainyl-CoA:carnitine CoA-transferase CaiB-like acyl-CoA transferase